MNCVFGFDYGSRLLGVAIGNCLTRSARALTIVTVRDGVPDWRHLDTLRQAWLPDAFVLGLPLTLEGSEQAASRNARRFATHLQKRYALPIYWVDERHSSQEAAQRFAKARAAGLKRRREAATIDAEAAAVILERWLTDETYTSH